MKRIFYSLAFAMVGLVASTQAQDLPANEISIQFGGVFGEGRVFRAEELPAVPFEEDNGYAGGIVYNRRIVGSDYMSLHFHLPVFFYENEFNGTTISGTTFNGSSSVTGFVTPGLLVQFLEGYAVQPYGFAGVGYAHVARLTPDEGLDSVDFANEGTWGVSAGGGLDVLFTEHFGIRGEVRSLSTGSDNGDIPGLEFSDPATRWGATGGLIFRW